LLHSTRNPSDSGYGSNRENRSAAPERSRSRAGSAQLFLHEEWVIKYSSKIPRLGDLNLSIRPSERFDSTKYLPGSETLGPQMLQGNGLLLEGFVQNLLKLPNELLFSPSRMCSELRL
jgi:hypothetical protein